VQGRVDAQLLVVRDGAQLNGAVNAGGNAKPKPSPATPAPVAG
jgi:cytoskeletal protein CcmA (bactofilin family)